MMPEVILMLSVLVTIKLEMPVLRAVRKFRRENEECPKGHFWDGNEQEEWLW
jgi:hypothetical protein